MAFRWWPFRFPYRRYRNPSKPVQRNRSAYADNHGGCDLGLMSIGAYAPRDFMRGAHMDPEGGVAMGREVGCKRMVPMHWGTFILSFEPFDEPRQRLSKRRAINRW